MKSLGSEILGTKEIRVDEGLLFIEAAIENGSDLETAYKDMHMIDNMFMIQRNYILAKGYMSLTWRGNQRKNQTLSDAFMSALDNRVSENKETLITN